MTSPSISRPTASRAPTEPEPDAPAGLDFVDLTGHIYARVKEMILTGALPPGQKLVQEDLARELGVSRTPLLKALQRLEHELLIEKIPRRGVVVRKLALRDLLDAFDCREGLEVVAARLAAERITAPEAAELRALFAPFKSREIDLDAYMAADRVFHRKVFACARNRVLSGLEFVGNIHTVTYQRGLIRPPSETLPEHAAIIRALTRHDAAAAEAAMKQHLRRSRERLARLIEEEHP
jgi:DNA-binding GntR family transcriptional regulator